MGWEATIPAAHTGGGSGGDDARYEVPEPGNHIACLVGLIDLGSHEQLFEGVSTGWRRRVFMVWELLAEQKSDGSPFYLGREFTLSWHEKSAFRQWFEKWRCKKYAAGDTPNPAAALGQGCLLTVVTKSNRDGSRTYAMAEGISALPRGSVLPRKPTYPPLAWRIGETAEERQKDKPPEDAWLPFSFGKPLADLIRSSPEWNGQPVPKNPKPANGKAGGQGGGATAAGQAAMAAQGDADEEGIPF